MKLKFRLLSLLLVAVMLLVGATACATEPSPLAAPPTGSVSGSEPGAETPPETSAPETPEEPLIFETVYPIIRVSDLEYTLSEQDVKDFEAQVAVCELLYYGDDEEDRDALKAALYRLNSMKVAVEAQSEIAELLYDLDLSDLDARENYNEAEEIYIAVYRLFWDFLGEAREGESPLRDTVLAFIESEYPVLYTKFGDSDSLYEQMVDLETQFTSYNGTASAEEAYPLYTQYLRVARQYAEAYGYENYYEYATDAVYARDYGKGEREAFRSYVKEYLVPLCRAYAQRSSEEDAALTYTEYLLSNRYLYDDYETLPKDYLAAYLKAMPNSARDAMEEAFEEDRILIGDREDSYYTAFVQYVGNTPICYFHEEMKDLTTVSHELGHYYADSVNPSTREFAYDLSETHSQTNTLLMFRYLENTLDSKAFDAFVTYSVYNMLYQAVSSAIRDEFDERVFSDPQAYTYTVEELTAIMEELIEEYNVADLSSNITTQLLTYWNRLGLSQPVYHISYATSLVTALQVYEMSLTDFEGAAACYCKLVENIQWDSTFLGTVAEAGLTSPFEEETFLALEHLIGS